MKKTLLALTTSAVVATATLAPTSSAQAYCRGCAVGAGIIGGMILGGAIAGARPYYYGEPAPVYVAPRRVCYADREYWSPRLQAYVVRQVRVPCY